MYKRVLLACLLTLPALPGAATAASAPFDLKGPGVRVSVTHGGVTLPIARVPNLAAGDRLSIAADLPEDQGARYLMIAAFLRGATNPPPKSWFFQAKTWERKHNTLSLTVPEGARQLVLFLVPDSGGDFDAVVHGVRDQPGTFVRASQELNQASLDRARLDAYLDGIHAIERDDPTRLAAASPLLTRSLSIKLNQDCLQQPADAQAACLTQDRESLLLADSHSSSLAETLAGAPTDLAFQVSATAKAGYGYYSPYIGMVRDLAHIFGAFQSTQLQYIPALSRMRDDSVRLLLNAAPSFGKPTSVMVIALPAIDPVQPPPLRRADPDQLVCAARSGAVLAVEGAPLIYATRYAHDMVLRVTKPGGGAIDLPVTADPERGGYVLGQQAFPTAGMGDTVEGRLHGNWGFAPFDGPRFTLQIPRTGSWHVANDGDQSPVIGRDDSLSLEGSAPSCVDAVELKVGTDPAQPVTWKADGADGVVVTLPLAKASPGKMTLLVHQHGIAKPDAIALTALAEAARIDGFVLHAGDTSGELTGTRLDTVTALTIGKIAFKPGKLTRSDGLDHLSLIAADPADAAALTAGQSDTANVTLADGRSRSLSMTIAPPRPAATLISKSATAATPAGVLPIAIDGDAVAADAQLTFSIRASGPTRFTGRETIEIATVGGRASASVAAGTGYTPQDDRVAVVSIDLGKALGSLAYGPLQFRVVQDGVAGAWSPLATLVRLPRLTGLSCAGGESGCTLTGSNLFLIDAVADNAAFTGATAVPEGFTGASLAIRKLAGDKLFLRLRDDPAAAARVRVPAGQAG